MPTKITRSAKPAPKPHKPNIPIRKPALVKASDTAVEQIEVLKQKGTKGHYWGDKETFRYQFLYHLTFAVIVLTLAAAYMGVRQLVLGQMITQEICSTVGKSDQLPYATLWLEQQPGWKTPKEKETLLRLCYERSRPF